jgi:hypothetical protein
VDETFDRKAVEVKWIKNYSSCACGVLALEKSTGPAGAADWPDYYSRNRVGGHGRKRNVDSSGKPSGLPRIVGELEALFAKIVLLGRRTSKRI